MKLVLVLLAILVCFALSDAGSTNIINNDIYINGVKFNKTTAHIVRQTANCTVYKPENAPDAEITICKDGAVSIRNGGSFVQTGNDPKLAATIAKEVNDKLHAIFSDPKFPFGSRNPFGPGFPFH